MRYKIESFFHETFFIYGKKELFIFIDTMTRRNSFFSIFSRDFEKSFEGGFFVKESHTVSNEYGYNYAINEYVKSLYIIKDEKGFVVDYSKLYSEYQQSRDIQPYKNKIKRKYKVKDRSTSSYRKSRKKARFRDSKHTYRREYSLMCQDKEDGIKVRDKRLKDLKSQLIHYYDDEYDLRWDKKSWKSKKQKHQWGKI